MNPTQKRVAEFLRKESFNKSVNKYVLRSAGKGRTGIKVEDFEITESLSIDELGNLALMIVETAQNDADGHGPMVQRYTLTSVITGEDKEEAASRVTFRMRGNADLDVDGDEEAGEEAPNMRGLTQQLMRHNEVNNRTMVGNIGTMLNLMTRRMESQDRMIEKLWDDRMRSLELIEEAHGRRHERDLETMRETKKEERLTIGINKMMMFVPVLLDKLSGGKMPAKLDATMLMFKELVQSMSIDQFESVRRQLSPEQQIVFFTLLKKFQEQKQLPNGTAETSSESKKDN